MTRRAALPAFAAMALGLCAMQAPTLTYDPRHFQNDDPLWELFNQTRVTPDRARGVYTAVFPASLTAREGSDTRVVGFILPLDPTPSSRHFMLVRRNTGCPFCPPNAPTEAVEVMADAPVRYTGDEVRMTGRLKLVPSSGDGLFFRLQGASVVAR